MKEMSGLGVRATSFISSLKSIGKGRDRICNLFMVQRVDTLVQRADSVIPAAALPILADTVSQAADTTATDTLRRQAPRPTLPALMRPYFVLKLVRDPASNTVRLDTVSMAYERILGVLDYPPCQLLRLNKEENCNAT